MFFSAVSALGPPGLTDRRERDLGEGGEVGGGWRGRDWERREKQREKERSSSPV